MLNILNLLCFFVCLTLNGLTFNSFDDGEEVGREWGGLKEKRVSTSSYGGPTPGFTEAAPCFEQRG